MILELLIFVAVIVVPAPLGYALARKWPGRKPVKNALIAALPVSLPFFGFALWITLTQDMSIAEDATVENLAPVWAIALYVLGVVTFITGLGLGLLGDSWARKTAEAAADADTFE